MDASLFLDNVLKYLSIITLAGAAISLCNRLN